tara:strand:- start:59 stop:190 length:132 start_codon:yes stop_codon:yes gene_type:complete
MRLLVDRRGIAGVEEPTIGAPKVLMLWTIMLVSCVAAVFADYA